jgi:hypothetical protein
MRLCRPPIVFFFFLAPLVLLSGCEIIAGIDDKTLADARVDAGTGGAGGGSTSSGGAGGGSTGAGDAGGPIVGDPLCAPGSLGAASCEGSSCNDGTDTQSTSCHCGACDHSCGGSMCVLGHCKPIIMSSALPFVYRVATNGKVVYFASSDASDTNGKIFGLPLDANRITDHTPFELSTGSTAAVEVIAADCDNVYFAEKFGSKVFRIPLAGGAPSLISDQDYAVSIIVADGANVYWITGSDGSGGMVKMWDPMTKIPRPVASGQPFPFGLAVDKTHIYWSIGGSDPTAGKGIRRAIIPVMAEQPSVNIVIDSGQPTGIAVDEESVYWVEKSPPSIMRAPKAGGSSGVTLATAAGQLGDAIAVDATHVYWIDDAGVRKRRKDGTGPAVDVANTMISGEPISAYWFTLDRSRVYFATPSATDSTVMWVAK